MVATQLLSIPQAAARVGVSRIRVWQWVNDKRLPAVKLGNYWFIDESDLQSVRPLKRGRPRKDEAFA
jgi:excisionase family DNA binding protein